MQSGIKHAWLLKQPQPLQFNLITPNTHQRIALCLCNNNTLSLTEAPLKKNLASSTGETDRPAVTPLGHVLWNFQWFLSIPGSYLKRMVKSSGWLVLKTWDFYFYPENVTALSKLCPERLPAMSWIRLKTSGNPVFKTPGRYIFLVSILD